MDQEALYGQLLMPYLLDPNNLFVISSDFCHWGQRFNYTYYEKSSGPIYKCIEKLDKAVSLSPLLEVEEEEEEEEEDAYLSLFLSLFYRECQSLKVWMQKRTVPI